MEERRSSGRTKKVQRNYDEEGWECTMCTYRNLPEAFKCDMCECRKGTSTRKPKINQQVLTVQQVSQQFAAPPPKKEKKEKHKKTHGALKKSRHPRLKNIDRSTARSMEVTVGGVTVVVTDYQPKKEKKVSGDLSSTNHSNTTSPTPSDKTGENSETVSSSDMNNSLKEETSFSTSDDSS